MYRGEENGRAATLRLLPHPQGSRSFVVRDQPRHRNLSVFRKLLLSCRLLLCCLYSSNVSGGRYSSALSVSLRRPPPGPARQRFPKHARRGRERAVGMRAKERGGSRTGWPAGRRCRRPSASTARECPRAAAGTAQCRRFRPGSRTDRQSPRGTGARDAVPDTRRRPLGFALARCTTPGSPRPAPGQRTRFSHSRGARPFRRRIIHLPPLALAAS